MALEPIIDLCVALTALVRPSDKLYDYTRINVEPESVQSVFGVTDATNSRGWSIRAWMWSRTETRESWSADTENIRLHTLRLQGYWEVNDSAASEVAFRVASEAIAEKFRNLPHVITGQTITGVSGALMATVPDCELIGPPQILNDAEHVVIGETYLCHSVRILLDVQERVERIYLT